MYRLLVVYDWIEAHQAMLGVALLVALVPVGYVLWRRSQREQARYREALAAMGFDFERRESGALDHVGLDREVQRLACRHESDTKWQDPLVAGLMRRATVSGEELLFELHLTRFVRAGDEEKMLSKQYRAFAVQRAGAGLPVFQATPQGTLGHLLTASGLRDGIDLEAWPEFSKRYRLSGEDCLAVEALFSGPAAQYLSRRAGWVVQGAGDWVVVLRDLPQARPGGIREFVDEGRQIVATLVAR